MNSRQQTQALTSVDRIQLESTYRLGLMHLSKAEQTASTSAYSQAVTLLHNAASSFNEKYDLNPNSIDLVTLKSYLKAVINAVFLLALNELERGETEKAKSLLDVNLENYNHLLEQKKTPNLTLDEIKQWKIYQSLHKKLKHNKYKTHPQKHTTQDKEFLYQFEQIPNDGRSLLGQEGHCALKSIGVTAHSLRELIANCKEGDFKQVEVLIGNQIYNDYYDNINSNRKRVNLDDAFYAELSTHFKYYREMSTQQSQMVSRHTSISSTPLNEQSDQQSIPESKRFCATVLLEKVQAEFKLAEESCQAFTKRPDVIKNYLLNKCEDNWLGSCMLLAWARLAKRSLKIWQENMNDTLSSSKDFEYINPDDTDTIHIIHNRARNHFERLKLVWRKPNVDANLPLPYTEQCPEYKKSIFTLQNVLASVQFVISKEVTKENMTKDIRCIHEALIPFTTEIKKVDSVTRKLNRLIYKLNELLIEILDDLTTLLFKEKVNAWDFYKKHFADFTLERSKTIYHSIAGHLAAFFDIKPVNPEVAKLYEGFYRHALTALQKTLHVDSELYGMIDCVLPDFQQLQTAPVANRKRKISTEVEHSDRSSHGHKYMFFGCRTDFLYDPDTETTLHDMKQSPSTR